MKDRACLHHRTQYYYDGLDRLLEGKDTPEYVRYRYKKLKAIKKKLGVK